MKNNLLIDGKKYAPSSDASEITGYSLEPHDSGLFETLFKFAFVTMLVLTIVASGAYSLSYKYPVVARMANGFVDRFDSEVYIPTVGYLTDIGQGLANVGQGAAQATVAIGTVATDQTASVLSSIGSGLSSVGSGFRSIFHSIFGTKSADFVETPVPPVAVVNPVASSTVTVSNDQNSKSVNSSVVNNGRSSGNIVTRVVEQPTYVSNVTADVSRSYVDQGLATLKNEINALSNRMHSQADEVHSSIAQSSSGSSGGSGGGISDLNSFTTSDLHEGSNLYFTNNRVLATLGASTSTTFGGNVTATTYFGDGSNLTGLLSFSTSTTRGAFSNSVTGLAYSTSTGVTSLTAGYSIPLTASTTEWANKVGSQWVTNGSNISYVAGNVGIGTTTPASKLSVAGDAYFGSNVTASGTLSIAGNTTFATDNAYDIGATSASRPRTGYFATSIIAGSNGNKIDSNALTLSAGSYATWQSVGTIIWPSNGVMRLANAGETDFSRLQLGGTTSAFPSIKRSGQGITFRLADDSADATTTMAALTATAASGTSTFAGTVGIGTTTPFAKLTIVGASGSTADIFNIASSSAASALKVTAAGMIIARNIDSSSNIQQWQTAAGSVVAAVDQTGGFQNSNIGMLTVPSVPPILSRCSGRTFTISE